MKRIFTPVGKKTILIVDDDGLAIHIYREKLQGHGFKVEVVGDGATALQTLKKDVVDLVILDLCLPGISAVELIKNIRSDSDMQSLPVIAFSNPYLSNLTRAGLEAGATKCVAKADGTPEQLLELVRELGVGATSTVVVSSVVGTLEADQEKLAATLLINGPEALAKLRASHQVFARAEAGDSREV